jgi:hypothetical protein
MRTACWSIALLLLAAAYPVPAATFHCDPVKGRPDGDGSAARPWRTIEEAIAAKRIQIRDAKGSPSDPKAPVKPGDTILLRSGWHGVIRIPGGVNDAFVTIAAAPGQTPQVGWIAIDGGRKWKVKGLTVSPSLAPTPLRKVPSNLVMLGERGDAACAELVVEDCFVYSVLDASRWTAKDWMETASSGIWLGRNGTGHVARNNYVLNTRFGINLCAPGVLCEGNVVTDFSADGIRVTRDGQVVQYNVVKNIFVSAADGDKNHDDGIQAFLFNKGWGTLRDVTVRGNLILSRERDDLPFPAGMQGIGFFDGPLVNFTVERNVVMVNHWHGITLGDAQGCTIRENACYSRWGGRARPWICLGQKRKQAKGNTVRDNLAHTFNFKADPEVKAERNEQVTEAAFNRRMAELAAEIDTKFGKVHPAAKRPRLEARR